MGPNKKIRNDGGDRRIFLEKIKEEKNDVFYVEIKIVNIKENKQLYIEKIYLEDEDLCQWYMDSLTEADHMRLIRMWNHKKFMKT